MLKVALLNMPFAGYHMPSIGLTQIKGVTDRELGDRVQTQVIYASLDFGSYVGLDFYETVSTAFEQLQAYFPDWFFRQAAFPDEPDNAEEYFARFFPGQEFANFRRVALEKRRGIETAFNQIIDRYKLDQMDVVGFTSMFFENNPSFAMARLIKARNPHVITVMGGATSESPSGEEYVKNVPAMDYVFSGPGLKTFPRFLTNILEGRPELNDQIDGVFSKVNQGQGIGAMGPELDINVYIPLDYDPYFEALDEKFPAYDIRTILPFETSRGCWWGEHAHCSFCGLNKNTMAYRAMRPDLAVELIRSLFKYRGRASVLICVDNILQRQYVKEVFPYLDTPDDMFIFYQLKANLQEREVEAMARARVKAITPGFESLNSYTLKLMDKGVTAFHNLQVMKYCSLHDVFPGWNLLVGSPGEPEETYEKYCRELHSIVHLPAPQALFSIHFNRYSPYFDRASDFGLKLKPSDFYSFLFPFPEESIENIAYEFKDENIGADYVNALSRWIDRINERIAYWRTRYYSEDGLLPPKLYFFEREGETFVYDSRDGHAKEIPIRPALRRLMQHLNEPRRISVLASELKDVPDLDLENDVRFLQEHWFLFQEGEKIMNLVFPHEPPDPSLRSRALGAGRKLKDNVPANAMMEPAMAPIGRTARRAVRPAKVGV
ncbi:MAG TPA: RiPP maturation radical SAM C-methyltransferase [Thermoanaerobaculia bacterium]|nr:RiPP maturation radical SAM C-methyltransferase [Thermoanaerobaculia bacterium]